MIHNCCTKHSPKAKVSPNAPSVKNWCKYRWEHPMRHLFAFHKSMCCWVNTSRIELSMAFLVTSEVLRLAILIALHIANMQKSRPSAKKHLTLAFPSHLLPTYRHQKIIPSELRPWEKSFPVSAHLFAIIAQHDSQNRCCGQQSLCLEWNHPFDLTRWNTILDGLIRQEQIKHDIKSIPPHQILTNLWTHSRLS